jgi:flagellar M-ring protein FliF
MAELREQLKNLWERFSPRQRWIILGSALLLFISVLTASYFVGGKPQYVPLFADLESKDAGDVAARLQEMKIPFEIINNGTAISVQQKDVYKTRLELARQGLPRGNKGFEIFDESKFGTTEFQNRVKLLQALQGELTRTIEGMAEVDKARVHIVLPEDSLYKKNEKAATASIMLKLKPRAKLSPEQVKGIVNLTAHSIRGLKAENITVVDNFARVLNENIDPMGLDATINIKQVELTRKKQDEMQKALETLLEQVLGPNKAAVRVSLELSFDQKVVDKQTFEPVVDDKGILRSTQESNESFKGTNPQQGGPPGTTSNIPGYVTNSANSQSTFEKKDATRNYEINETKEKTVVAPGGIKRISVGVLLDASISKAQQDSVAKAVASAAGINVARGDVISVETVPFSTEIADKIKKEEQDQAQEQQRTQWTKIGAGAAVVLLIAGVGFWVLKRRQEEELEVTMMESEMTAGGDTESVSQQAINAIRELSPEEIARNAELDAIEALSKAKPEEVAMLLKTWLAEE